jgi:hypothetical protein
VWHHGTTMSWMLPARCRSRSRSEQRACVNNKRATRDCIIARDGVTGQAGRSAARQRGTRGFLGETIAVHIHGSPSGSKAAKVSVNYVWSPAPDNSASGQWADNGSAERAGCSVTGSYLQLGGQRPRAILTFRRSRV